MPYSRPAYRPPGRAPTSFATACPDRPTGVAVRWSSSSLAVLIFLGYLAATLVFALLNPSYGSSLSTRASAVGPPTRSRDRGQLVGQ